MMTNKAKMRIEEAARLLLEREEREQCSRHKTRCRLAQVVREALPNLIPLVELGIASQVLREIIAEQRASMGKILYGSDAR